ncbi:MAG: magnesium transporter [Pseudomonadota bacterium]
MPVSAKQDNAENHLRLIADKLESGTLHQVRNLLNALHPAEIAHVLESLKPVDREIVWRLTAPERRGEILVELNEEVRGGLIEATDIQDFISAVGDLEHDDLADLLHDVPEVVLEQVLMSMDNQDRSRLEAVLSYDEDSAGGLMSLDTLTVRPDVTLDVVLRYLRQRAEMPDLTDSLIVVDRADHYLGVLPLSVLLTRDERRTVGELMITDVAAIPATLSASEVAILFENRDLVSAPVVDEQHRLIGRITVDDVVDVIREEADHSLMSMAGLDEEQDMFAPVILSTKRRAVWLGINLFTAFLASWVIGLFEATIQQVVALAVLMPIVASMGGIAGSQTLTLVIRGLALRQIGATNAHLLMTKELAVGALNGLIWALVVATVAGVWFHHAGIGALIGGAMMINLICAALAGASIPLLLHRFGVDPALAGGVILTTVTDVVGFMAFLGLATLYLV